MRSRLWQSFFAFSLALLTLPVARAQDQAAVTGTVTDPTGAVIPGAGVVLSNTQTAVSFKAETDRVGSYRFLSVPPATGYSLTITHDGFVTGAVSNITLIVGVTRTQNIVLTVGGETQTVSVSAGDEIVTLNTTDSTVGNNIDVQQLNDLPVYDRTNGIRTLMYQQPGVDSNQGAVTGARIDQSEVTVDGMDVDDLATGDPFNPTVPAPVDSVAQFSGAVAGLGSDIGTGSGAQFQLVTKGGTNQFHGGVNEYHRDTALVANPWFNNLTRLKRTPYIRNQFGGNIGGPIKRDKLFFFFNWAQSRVVQSLISEPIVPLDGFRNGTLNYINSNAGCTGSATLTTAKGCISTLSANDVQSLDPAGIGFDAPMLSYINSRYPHVNDTSHGDGVNTGGYRFTYPSPANSVDYVARIDYNLKPTQQVFGRFTINRLDETYSAPEFPTDPTTHTEVDRSYAYVVGHSWEFGNNKVNRFYYGDTISKFNFPDLYNPLGANQPSFSGLSGPFTSFDGQKRRFPVPEVRDDFTWQLHRHALTFGGTFKFIKNNSLLVSNFNYPGIGLQGPYLAGGLDDTVRPSDINQSADGVGINDYDNLFASALGVIGQVQTNYSYDHKGNPLPAGAGLSRAYRFYQTEAYFGDTWKISSKLTMSYGVRWQFYTVPYETNGFESVNTPIPLKTFIQDRLAQQKAGNTSNSGLPLFSVTAGGKANNGPNYFQPNYKDIAPRVAISFSPFSSHKTVINAGAGIVYDRSIIDALTFLLDQVPNLYANTQFSYYGDPSGAAASLAVQPRVGSGLSYPSSLNPPAPASSSPMKPFVDSTGTPYGLGAGAANFVFEPGLKDPYSIAMNAGVQQELPGHMILKLNYVGRLGRRLLADADANQVIDVPDYTGKSTQTMSQAFAAVTSQLRAGKQWFQVTPQPWFEDVLYPIFGPGLSTNYMAGYGGALVARGDISDTIYALNSIFGTDGFFPENIGIPAQFGSNTYLTNMGSSNYHGMLVTLDKNMSNGLRFEFNYTWSHSIDNTSVSANANSLFTNSNMICDILHPRACRSDSDFDVRQEISSNFTYNLPFGRGQAYIANAPLWAEEVLGGWNLSGLPSYRTGLPMTANSDAFLSSFDNLDPAIFTGNKADLQASVNVNHTSNVVYMFKGGAAGAAKVLSEFRGPLGIEYGQRNIVRGPGGFFFDAGLGKAFPIIENRLNLNFRADAFNLFNHPVFSGPLDGIGTNTGVGAGALDIVNNAARFGQLSRTEGGLSNTNSGARVAQLSLRLDF